MSAPVVARRSSVLARLVLLGVAGAACQSIGRSPDLHDHDAAAPVIREDAPSAAGDRGPVDAAVPSATDAHPSTPAADAGGDATRPGPDVRTRPLDALPTAADAPGGSRDASADVGPSPPEAGADATTDARAGNDAHPAAPDAARPLPDAELRPALPDFGDRDLLGPPVAPPRSVVLLIGDGMGPAHIEAARRFVGGPLRMETALPHRGRLTTASLDGVTDSAAAATAMGSGVVTTNHFVGLDRHGGPLESAVALAHRLGARAGLVTTASLPHATPAGFGAHARSRYDYTGIAASLVREQPEVLLGGGRMWFLPAGAGSGRADAGLLDHLAVLGYQRVDDRAALASAVPDAHGRLIGLFAPDLMQYVADRPAETTEPTLAEMTATALRFLETAPGGFFLMVEGAKIDLAAHANQIRRVVPEVLAFDEAVGVVVDWAAARPEITVIVTADHETGELAVTGDAGPGELPPVRWGRGSHSNRSVDVFGQGEATAVFDGQVRGNRWIRAVIDAGLTGAPPVPPPPALVPDGRFDDLFPAAAQRRPTNFGAGLNQLDGLFLGADADALGLGLAGLFERDRNGVAVLIDVDYGAGTGLPGLAGGCAARATPLGRLRRAGSRFRPRLRGDAGSRRDACHAQRGRGSANPGPGRGADAARCARRLRGRRPTVGRPAATAARRRRGDAVDLDGPLRARGAAPRGAAGRVRNPVHGGWRPAEQPDAATPAGGDAGSGRRPSSAPGHRHPEPR
jgi:alkaline phosphatase